LEFEALRSTLHRWYQQHKRSLPWRENVEPYAIWLSEIILQQTRVAQGLPYYERFLDRFPKIEQLADAPQEEVLKLWEGLGYYSRARNMQAAAQMVRDEFQGEFPSNYEDIKSLKGVGDYTAAAIASFAFDLPHAVLDGNVFRVLSRLTADETPINTGQGKKRFQRYADQFLDPEKPALHNQALMEFGALQCVPRNPNCLDCPLKSACLAYKLDKVEDLPQKKRKVYDKQRYLNYFHLLQEDKVLVEKREAGIWHGLYQFPLIETEGPVSWPELLEHLDEVHQQELINLKARKISLARHKLSHQSLHINVWYLNLSEPFTNAIFPESERRLEKELANLAFPRPLRKYLDENQLTLPLD